MKSQPQNPEFRNNPENFHPCIEHLKHMLKLMSDKIITFFIIKFA